MANFPNRSSNSLPGSQFLLSVGNSGNRDTLITEEIIKGNFPDFLRQLVPVTISENNNTLIYKVMPDYLALGNNQDYVRVPLGASAAQRIADAFGCILPTPKISDQIWKAAKAKLPPKPMSAMTSTISGKTYSPQEFLAKKMTDTDSFIEHNRLIQQQLQGIQPGELVAGSKKDVVITNELINNPNRLAIHGLHDANGKPIQAGGLSKHHIDYSDYSSGVRLVDKEAILNGKTVDLVRDVLQNPQYAYLVSNEGALKQVAYNYKKPLENQLALNNPKIPNTNSSSELLDKVNKYLDQISKVI